MDNLLELGDASGGPTRTLIRALEKALLTVPVDTEDLEARASVVRQVISALAKIGVDGESLLRYGMAPRAALPLLIGLVSGGDSSPIDLEVWRALLRVDPAVLDAEPEDAARELFASIHSVDSWVISAPLDDILLFVPPTTDALNEYVLGNHERSEFALPYVWLNLRSTQDDLERWPTEVLHLEFRWRNDLQRSPFPDSALDYEGPDTAMLNEQIAFRAASDAGSSSAGDDELFWQLQDTAVSFLKRDRHQEAAALFEFHGRLHPDDPRTLNNLGFCKLPTDASASLDLLQRAESAGYSPLLINVYNQCCCLVRLNRLPEALDRGEYFWQRELDPDDIRSGYIWVEHGGEWALMSNAAVDLALAQLMAQISAVLGRADRAARWESRAEALLAEPEEMGVSFTVDD